MAASVVFRPAMIYAYAALIILATRRSGWLVDRIAAAGRAAFTNYLGTSLVMTILFYGYGFGLYGTMGRAEVWLVVTAMWAVMLLWSRAWPRSEERRAGQECASTCRSRRSPFR